MNERKYVDPKADLTFKKIFGEHPDLIASLLNALLPLPEDGKITSIEYLTPELVPDDPLHKDTIVDVRCKDQNGRQFIVEMQMIWSPDYNQRALFNAAKAYSRELPKAGDYSSLKTVYSLNLLNENLAIDTPQWYHHYQLEHSKIKGETIDGLQLVFVELKKFRPQTWPERKMMVLWLRFLTEIDGSIPSAPPELAANPEVSRALEMVEVAALTPAERARYDGFQDWLCRERRRTNAELRALEIPGLEAKIEAAKAKLKEAEARADAAETRADEATAERDAAVEKLRQDKLDAARQMKADGMPVEAIAKYTGLAAHEIGGL